MYFYFVIYTLVSCLRFILGKMSKYKKKAANLLLPEICPSNENFVALHLCPVLSCRSGI